MSAAERALEVIKDVLIFRETINRLRADVAVVAQDLEDLAGEQQALNERVARLEGFLDGATAASRPRRLSKRDD